MMKDFYYILGADRKATPRELDEAYRKLAHKLQPANDAPDHFLDSHFREITEAYEFLSNPTRRRRYDKLLKKSQQGRFYWFRIRHLNIAATLAFLLFTGLFGWYVSRILSNEKVKKVAVVQPIAAPKPKHHKKKHFIKATYLPAAKTHSVKNDTVAKISATVKTPVTLTTPAVYSNKPAPVAAMPVSKPKPVVNAIPVKPAPPVVNQTFDDDGDTYMAELRSNVTGVVSLHEQPNYASAILVNIPNHTQAQVLEKGQRFYKVKFNGQTGWVAKWTVAGP